MEITHGAAEGLIPSVGSFMLHQERTHTRDEPFGCSQCDFEFSTSSAIIAQELLIFEKMVHCLCLIRYAWFIFFEVSGSTYS